jgi:hypothetical protein
MVAWIRFNLQESIRLREAQAMEPLELYETIYKRKSIRKYAPQPLKGELLADISRQIENLVPLYPGIMTEIKIVSPSEVKGLIQVKAPHYLIGFSETKEGYLTNTGFLLQQMDLFFSAQGIGCCWQGWPRPTRELRKDLKLEFIVALAFGLPGEKIHRESVGEFRRKPLSRITDIGGLDELLEPVRLAPTPSEPWFFTGTGSCIQVLCRQTRGLKAVLFERLNRIEIGITVCHLWLAAGYFHRRIDFSFLPPQSLKMPQGYFQVLTAYVL